MLPPILHGRVTPWAPAARWDPLDTVDGAPLYLNYATVAPGPTASQQHTGSEVRIAAQGPQAANVVGVIDQTDENAILARALGLQ